MSGSPSNRLDNPAALALVQRGWAHLRAQRPLAAWSAWQQALRIDPEDRAAREALDNLAAAPALPVAARSAYRFRPPATESRRRVWDQALREHSNADLSRSIATFEQLVATEPDDPPALYNLALVQAWDGRNLDAIASLARFVDLAAGSDFEAAANAWTLAEVLRHGGGAEVLADDLNYSGHVAWPVDRGDPARLVPTGHLLLVPIDPAASAGLLSPGTWPPFEWLDRPLPPAGSVPDADTLPQVLASLVWADGQLRYTSPDANAVDSLLTPGTTELGSLIEADPSWHRERRVLPLNWLDAAIFRFRLPAGLDAETRQSLSHQAIAHAYEDLWPHVPRHGLSSDVEAPAPEAVISPFEASQRLALHPDAERPLAARLEGIIRLREQLARRPGYESLYARYSFDRLRRRLGLDPLDPNTVPRDDFRCMSLSELQALDPATLTPPERQSAHRSAEGLGRPALARRLDPSPPDAG